MNRFASYPHNGELIKAAADLGHVRGFVLDATWGRGTWWACAEAFTEVTGYVGMDLNPRKVPITSGRGVCADFRRPPFRPGSFQTIFYDPRYKLNGTPTPDEGGPDERYGADAVKPWQEIMAEMLDGLWTDRPGVPKRMAECPACWATGYEDRRAALGPCSCCGGRLAAPGGLAPLLAPNGRLLVKCQDQVCSGRMRWQTYEMTKRAEAAGLELVERLDYEIHPRPQPLGRRTVHAAGNCSTLLIFGRPPIRLVPSAR